MKKNWVHFEAPRTFEEQSQDVHEKPPPPHPLVDLKCPLRARAWFSSKAFMGCPTKMKKMSASTRLVWQDWHWFWTNRSWLGALFCSQQLPRYVVSSKPKVGRRNKERESKGSEEKNRRAKRVFQHSHCFLFRFGIATSFWIQCCVKFIPGFVFFVPFTSVSLNFASRRFCSTKVSSSSNFLVPPK